MKKLSIIVPVYFNELSLIPLFTKLLEVEKQLLLKNIQMEFIFVDDGSKDKSFSVLLAFKEQRPNDVKLIKLTRNFGAVNASRTGCRYATGDCFLILAADLQDPPELIPELITHWEQGSKFTICIRTSRKDPLLKKLFAKLYYKLIHLLVDKTYPQGGYDLALMDKELLPYLINAPKNMYTNIYMYHLGFKPEVINYQRAERVGGKSRWTFSKQLSAVLNIFLGTSLKLIRLVMLIGLFVSVASIGYGVTIVVNAFLGKITSPGFPTIAALISLLLGLIIIMLGLIAEYLWRISDEVSSKPTAVIDQVY